MCVRGKTFFSRTTFLPARASEQGNVIGSVLIGECGSTLYVGLSRIVRNLIQKSTGWDHTFLSIFYFFIFLYIYVCMCVQKKIVIERTRDLIYLKFVATDFFPKIISPSAGENSGDLA